MSDGGIPLFAKTAENRDYDALVQNINLEDITSSAKNADVLRRLRNGDTDWNQELYILESEIDGDIDEFVVGAGDDLGWLGYFIGRSEVLHALHIYVLPEEKEQLVAFMRGIIQNQSIKELSIHTDLGDQGFESIGYFLRNHNALTHLRFDDFHVDTDCVQNIAMALEQCRHNSLRSFELDNSNASAEGFAEIAATLRTQSQLEKLHLKYNNIGRDGCVALGNTLSRWQSSNLKFLDLSSNNIDDLRLCALVEGMSNCSNLEKLFLSDNRSITAAGLRSMSPLLQSESCSLQRIALENINFGDAGAISLADGLRGNKSMRTLRFAPMQSGISHVGWAAFSKLLCDTSSINNTYLSNHTIERIGYDTYCANPPDIEQYLAWNRDERSDAATAICKILESHSDLDIKPFFQWKLKFLPVIINWFGRAQEAGLEESLGGRKLSSVYNFVRGMPMLVIGGQDKEKTSRRSRKRRLDGETK